MVAGKVKQAMGLQKSSSPAANPKLETTTTTPKHFPSPSSTTTTTTTKTPSSNHQKPVFSRSFGVYFPRSSAQVQPRPPDVTELLRIVEELKDRESQLKTKLVEQKLLKESAAIVPFLENEISLKNIEIECSTKRIESLEVDNERLRGEMESLMVRIEEQRRESGKKIKEMEEEIVELKRCLLEKNRTESKMISAGESDECSSSQRFLGLMDASAKSNLLRNLKRVRSMDIGLNQENQKIEVTGLKKEEVESERISEIPEISEIPIVKCKGPRVPKPPPRLSTPSTSSSSPSSSSSSSTSSSSSSSTSESLEIPINKASSSGISDLTTLPPIPPPPPPPFSRAKTTPVPPPPPPLPAAKGAKSTVAKVKKVPEVVEFYHSLMRRDSRKESGVGVSDVQSAANTRDMIGEIENRSAHLLAIKTDVETQGDFIRFLIKEVENAAFTNIEDVVAFVKWLDDELSYLVDERAVLKHFEWPETKADALREAAFGYCDLKKLESEASTFCEDIRQSSGGPVLKKMQALLEKLEHGVYNLSRMRESATKKYKGFCIPTEWMSETGFVSQIKLVSVKLAMKYMKRVSAELEAVGSAPEVEELMLQGVRFAFRVHQFAGGFDVETMRAFQELKNKARSCHMQIQNHQQQKLICRSTPC